MQDELMCKGCKNGLVIGDEMTTETIKEFLKTSIDELGINTVHIGGGEPLQHPDILQILDFLWQRNISTYLYTRGVLFDPNDGEYYPILHPLAVVFQKYGDVDKKRDRWGDSTGYKFGVMFRPCGFPEIVEQSIRNCIDHGVAICLINNQRNSSIIEELNRVFENRKVQAFMMLTPHEDREVTGYISEWPFLVKSNGDVIRCESHGVKNKIGNVKIKRLNTILLEDSDND